MQFISRLSISRRLSLLTFLVVIALTGTGITLLHKTENSLRADIADQTRHVVEQAVSLAAHYHALASSGKMPEEDAKQAASAAIGALRYGNGGYFWVHDMQPRMVMHPINPALNGQDLSTLKDPQGLLLFAKMTDLVRASGEGMLDYMWARNGSDKPVPKISYVKGFAPWGWVVGSGVYTDDIDAEVHDLLWQIILYSLGPVLLVLLALYGIGRSISRPLQQITEDIHHIADGNYNVQITGSELKTEIGELARAAITFRESGIKLQQMSEQAQAETQREAARAHKVAEITREFERTISRILSDLRGEALEMNKYAKSLDGAASATTQQAQGVVASAQDSSSSVATVASATEELSASVQEITRQVHGASQTANSAVSKAHQTTETMGRLSEAAERIGNIVSIISEIAGQTNLLALNATIEAARAGEAGKGFAVVASEVKNLASQTAKATEDITSQIEAMRGVVHTSSSAIGEVVTTISSMDSITSTIAAAVEQQGAATLEISRNIQRASASTQSVTQSIAVVAESVEQTKGVAGQTLQVAGQLQGQAQELEQAVQSFLRGVASA
jgi:methyl-accepting chemotaxis protein